MKTPDLICNNCSSFLTREEANPLAGYLDEEFQEEFECPNCNSTFTAHWVDCDIMIGHQYTPVPDEINGERHNPAYMMCKFCEVAKPVEPDELETFPQDEYPPYVDTN